MRDLSVYAGRWIALDEHQHIAGVGLTAEAAHRAGRRIRPKETLWLAWVTPHPPYLALPAWPCEPLKALLQEEHLWLVGGAVRDLLLQRPIHDWDFAVEGGACALARRVANALGGAYVALDTERDTGRVVVNDPASDAPITLDFAGLRGGDLATDLALRDFTINALALSLTGEFHDPTGGQADLEAGLVRTTHPGAFSDDPARLLRAVRACGELGFRLEADTAAALRAHRAALRTVAAERSTAELRRIVMSAPAHEPLALAAELGLLELVLPEVTALQEVEQSAPHHHRTAWEHTLTAVAAMEKLLALLKGQPVPPPTQRRVQAPSWAWGTLERTLMPHQTQLVAYLETPLTVETQPAELLKWGALLHDIGKAATRTVDAAERTHFYDHAPLGADLTHARLTALKFPNKARNFVTQLVAAHMRLIGMTKQPPQRRTSYRFYRATGEAGVGVILLALADALAVWGPTLPQDYWDGLLRAAEILLTHYFTQHEEIVAPPPLLTGHDLIALGISPGPELGRWLERLREAQVAAEIQTRAEAQAFIEEKRRNNE